jgi:hypothetical protein
MGCIINDDNPVDLIFGCTDPLALNYFSGATADDGSCFYEGDTIVGCMDPLALNYNPFANFDNGKVCEYEDCPEEVTIRPTDGAVFYTNTDSPSGGGNNEIIIADNQITFPQQNVAKGQAPPQQAPQSVPLTENCCTESVVGEPVTWNSNLQLCIVNKDTVCPEPLAVSVDGYVIGFDGEPVTQECCDQIDTAVWDPNFQIPNSRLNQRFGACIDNSFTPTEDCDLSFTDLNLNDDGTITYNEEIIVDTGGGDTGGGDTGGGDTGGGDTGGGGDDPDFCVTISDWGLVDAYSSYGNTYGYTENTAFLYLDTPNIGNLTVGQQIELSGFNVNPASTCWGITSPSNFNGLVVTILDIIDLSQTNFGVYSIITDLDLTTFFNNNTCSIEELEVIEESAQACIIYTQGDGTGGDGTGGGTSNDCFPVANFTSFSFENQAFISDPLLAVLPTDWNSKCGVTLPNTNYYIAIANVDDITAIPECSTFYLNEDFWIALSNSCYGPYVISSYANNNTGNLSINDLTQLPVQVIYNDGSFVFLDLSLTQADGDLLRTDWLEPGQGGPVGTCEEPSVSGNFSFCDPTKSLDNGGGNGNNKSLAKSLECFDPTIINVGNTQGLVSSNVSVTGNCITLSNAQQYDWDPLNDSNIPAYVEFTVSHQSNSDLIFDISTKGPISDFDFGASQQGIAYKLRLISSTEPTITAPNDYFSGFNNPYDNQSLQVTTIIDKPGEYTFRMEIYPYLSSDNEFEVCLVCNEVETNGGDTGGGDTGGGDTGGGDTGTVTTEIIVSDLSEVCCEELGNGLWTYIDGVCYWKPPLTPEDVSIGISENDIIVTDPFFEQPDDPECYDPNLSVINGSLGFYSGDVTTITDVNGIQNNNLGFNVNQITTFNSETDGFCNWVQLCAEIVDYDGTPFKLKLDLQGVLDCCEYDIFVDDISVSCTVQDSIEISTKNDCPGFTLNKVIDNKKSWVYNDGQPTNRVFAPSRDADIPWRYTNYREQSGVLENHSKLVLNSKELYLTFNMCNSELCDTTLNIFELIEYKNNFQSFWVKFIEQFVPATTIFISGEKWCTKPEQICKTYDDCGYDNSLNNSDLGLSEHKSSTNGANNKNGGNNGDTYNGEDSLKYDRTGDYGDNKSDGPVILGNNFFGVFITDDPSTIEEELTFPKGLVPLLEEGMDTFRNKMKRRKVRP